jgi:hypothetical protein
MTNLFKQKCFYVVLVLFLITCGLIWYSHKCASEASKLVDEIEYYDSIGNYHKIYYSKLFNDLKKENKQLYDSLKKYKEQIDYLVQFTHEKEYHTGQVSTKPKNNGKKDTTETIEPQIAKTYEYTSEPNDTFQYKLSVNGYTEPLWYSMSAKVKNKFTIVNKTDGDINHVVISPSDGGEITDVTVWKKKDKRTVWDRISVGPSVTAGYDVVNKQWGIMAGASVTIDLK